MTTNTPTAQTPDASAELAELQARQAAELQATAERLEAEATERERTARLAAEPRCYRLRYTATSTDGKTMNLDLERFSAYSLTCEPMVCPPIVGAKVDIDCSVDGWQFLYVCGLPGEPSIVVVDAPPDSTKRFGDNESLRYVCAVYVENAQVRPMFARNGVYTWANEVELMPYAPPSAPAKYPHGAPKPANVAKWNNWQTIEAPAGAVVPGARQVTLSTRATSRAPALTLQVRPHGVTGAGRSLGFPPSMHGEVPHGPSSLTTWLDSAGRLDVRWLPNAGQGHEQDALLVDSFVE